MNAVPQVQPVDPSKILIRPHASSQPLIVKPKLMDVMAGTDNCMVVSTQGEAFLAFHHYDSKGVLHGARGGPLPVYVSTSSITATVIGNGATWVEVMLSMERCSHAENGPVGVLLPEANSGQKIFDRNRKILWNGVPVSVCDPFALFVNEKLATTHLSKVVFTVVKSVGNDFAGDKVRQISWASGDDQVDTDAKKAKLEPYTKAIFGYLKSSNQMSELPKDLLATLTTLDHGVIQWGLDSGSNADDIEAARNDAMEPFLVKSVASMIKRSAGPGEPSDAVRALDKACAKVMKGLGRGLATQILNASTSQLPTEMQAKLRQLQRADVSRMTEKLSGSRVQGTKRNDAPGRDRGQDRSDKPARALSHDSGARKHSDAPFNPMLSVLYANPAFQILPEGLRKILRSKLRGLDGTITPDDVHQIAAGCIDTWRFANPEAFGAIRAEITAFRDELARGIWRTDLVDVLARSVKPAPLTTASSSHNKPVWSSSVTPSSTTSANLAPEEDSEDTEPDSDWDSDDVRTESSTEESSSSEKMREVDAGKGATSGTDSETDDETAPENEKS